MMAHCTLKGLPLGLYCMAASLARLGDSAIELIQYVFPG